MSYPNSDRFIVTRLAQGPWLVLDHQMQGTRLVASCPDEDDANAVADLMNDQFGDDRGSGHAAYSAPRRTFERYVAPSPNRISAIRSLARTLRGLYGLVA